MANLDQDKFIEPNGPPTGSSPNQQQPMKSSLVGPADVEANNLKRTYPLADETKLATIETGAEVNTVNSVFGRIGVVIAALGDYTDALITNTSTVTGATVQAALSQLKSDIDLLPSIPVDSVFGRIGAVVATLNDYTSNLLGNDSTVVGATITAALETLNTQLDGITLDSNGPGTNFLSDDGTYKAIGAGGAPVDSVFGRIGAVVATLGDYTTSLITNDSTVAGVTLSDALDNLNSGKLDVNSLSDANFQLYNEADPTKTVDVDLSAKTTATPSTLNLDDTGVLDDSVSVTNGMDVLNPGTLQAVIHEIDNALLNARSSGWRYGGVITVNAGDSTQVDVTPAKGEVLDNSDPQNPVYMPIDFAGVTGYQITDLVSTATFLYIDSNSQLQQTTIEPTRSQGRLRMNLGAVGVLGGVITNIASGVTPIQQVSDQVADVLDFLGILKKGLVISPNGANLSFDVSAGGILLEGINAWNDSTDPHVAPFSQELLVNHLRVKSDGFISSGNTTIDVANYDNGGTITPIGGGSSTSSIFVVYQFGDGTKAVQYGEAIYLNLTNAQEALSNGTNTVTTPPGFENAIIIGYIIVEKSAISLLDPSEAILVGTNFFGGLGGAPSGLSGVYLTAANNLSDLDNTATAITNLALTIGTNTQAWSANLDALAGLASAADTLPYFTASEVAALTSLSAFARTLLDDADANAMQQTLGVEVGVDVQAFNTYQNQRVINFEIGDGSTLLTLGTKDSVAIATFNGTLTGWYVSGDQVESGSIEYGITKNGVDIINAGTPPEIISNTDANGSNLTSWNTSFVIGDKFKISVASVATFTKNRLQLTANLA